MPRRLKDHNLVPGSNLAEPGKTLTQAIVGDLLKLIARGEIGIGELLPPERQLAESYKVSRVTVRAALKELVQMGLLDRRPAVGYTVVRKNPNDLATAPVALIYRDLARYGSGTSKSVPAIERQLAEQGCALLIGASGSGAEGENDCIQRLKQAGAGALIVAPAVTGNRSSELEAWIRDGRPVVLEGHPGSWLLPDQLAEQCDQVDIDNEDGVRQGVDYLVSLGHRSVGFLSAGPSADSERLTAFKRALPDHGLEARSEWIQVGVGPGRDGGRNGFHLLKKNGSMPTAVLCANDDVALGLIDAAQEAGLTLPNDLSVVGFDNESVDGPMALQALTTVDYSRDRVASEIARLLKAQSTLRQKSPERVRIPGQLIVRNSCVSPQ